MIFAYSSINFGTSSCDTTVDNLLDDDFARIRHLYSSGFGNGGRPARGCGRSWPSSTERVRESNEFAIYRSANNLQVRNLHRFIVTVNGTDLLLALWISNVNLAKN